jgi:hypothetical protein
MLSVPLRNYATQSPAWELFKNSFPELRKKLDPIFVSGFAQVTSSFCDARLRDDAQEFFSKQNLPGIDRMLRNARDRVNSCIELRSLQQANLTEYLNAEGGRQ